MGFIDGSRRLAFVLIALTTAACSTVGGEVASSKPAPTRSDDMTSPAPGKVAVRQILDEPERFIGQRVEVTGKAFFLAECPPPGSGDQTSCVVQGWLAEPDRGTLIFADLPESLPLAEGGMRVSCLQADAPRGACGDWQNELRYLLVGTVEWQVLGGQETRLLQLDVEAKTILP
jgi:hypothetical protein